jgi:hypothetical protein
VQLPQTVPSTASWQYVAPDGGAEHVPTVLPCAMLQTPEQHSLLAEHTSPVWTQ